ncbi:MAG: hypothetical protein QOH39_2530 [Verrucomicrobiota bacterium]
MPPASHSLIRTTSQGSILLIEEYDALAAAIASALKKFAPAHVTHVARSLAEATTLAKTITPALFVIDFDPAFPGLSGFLQKMQAKYQNAKVLVIAGKIPPEIAVEPRSMGALQFVEKPFDVPDFGAAVQALLGPWTNPETATPRGDLHSLGLADLLLAQCAGQRTVALEVQNDRGKSGEIYLREGRVTHAEVGRKSGTEALAVMLDWPDIEVRERERPRPVRRTMEADWTDLLVDRFRVAEAQQTKPSEAVEAAPPRLKIGKKIVAIDDTEMLLIFVEDVLMTADPDLQITTASDGASGVEEVTRVRPDLVLLDYSLPDFNGDEVCRRLLENDATAQIPVLMMSGHVPEMSKTAAMHQNVIATLEKPFLSEALIALVHKSLHEPRPPRKKIAAPRKATELKPPPPPPPVVTAKPPEILKPEVKTPAISKPSVPLPPAAEIPPVQAPPAVPPPLQVSRPPPPSKAPQPQPPMQPPGPRQPAPVPGPTSTVTPPKTDSSAEREKPVDRPLPPPRAPLPPPFIRQRPDVGADQVPPAHPAIFTAPVLSNGSNQVILGLFLDVVSVQLTPELRMGSIRAKPSSSEVSLHIASPAMRATLSEIGFQLGPVALDENGRITTVRLIPTRTPYKATPLQSALQIGGVSVVPINSTRRMQLTPAPHAPMTMHLLAHLELAGVELSPTFQIAQLVLKNRSNTVRVTLKSQPAGQEEGGTKCETLAVHLDHSAQIAELLLSPIR